MKKKLLLICFCVQLFYFRFVLAVFSDLKNMFARSIG